MYTNHQDYTNHEAFAELRRIGQYYSVTENRERALKLYDGLLQKFKKTDDTPAEVMVACCVNMADILCSINRKKAYDMYSNALEYRVVDPNITTNIILSKAIAKLEGNEPKQALALTSQATIISTNRRVLPEVAEDIEKLGSYLEELLKISTNNSEYEIFEVAKVSGDLGSLVRQYSRDFSQTHLAGPDAEQYLLCEIRNSGLYILMASKSEKSFKEYNGLVSMSGTEESILVDLLGVFKQKTGIQTKRAPQALVQKIKSNIQMVKTQVIRDTYGFSDS